jgi:hypothetical protein
MAVLNDPETAYPSKTPFGQIRTREYDTDTASIPVERTPDEQISDLMKPVADASHRLAEARRMHCQAVETLERVEQEFAGLTDQLHHAIAQHRGTKGLVGRLGS